MVEPAGPLGDRPEQMAAFRDYIAAFSAANFERFPEFYTDDIVFDLSVAPALHGKAAVVASYRHLFAIIREQVTLDRVSATPDTISANISVRFTALKDAPDFALQPMTAGDTLDRRFTVEYRLRDGLICALTVAPIR